MVPSPFSPFSLLGALLADPRRRLALLAALVGLALVVLAVALTVAPVDARPMLDPCTYERPVCPTYAPR